MSCVHRDTKISFIFNLVYVLEYNLTAITKKNEIVSERDEVRKELKTIQVQKDVEWESCKDLKDEFDKMRKLKKVSSMLKFMVNELEKTNIIG